MTGRTWIIFGAIVVILFGGLLFLSSRNSNNVDVSNVDNNSVQSASEMTGNIADHTLGTDENRVLLIEYGDYQCPGCASASEPLKTIAEKYDEQLTFVFRNYPLTSIHPNARAAAAAAETAGIMGKYWEMHDLLYANQTEWQSASANDRTSTFASYAEEIGLDRAEFERTLDERTSDINQKINFDTALGRKANVDSTPTLFINSEKIDQRVLDGELSTDANASPVYSDVTVFEREIIRPALEQAGYDNLPPLEEE